MERRRAAFLVVAAHLPGFACAAAVTKPNILHILLDE